MDLRRRIAATRWPERETVSDQSQGVQLAKLQALVHYWGTDYDWRKAEAKLNALPQFVTTIDGLDIQFIHVRSRHPNALPLIMTHGWPGSALELLKVIAPAHRSHRARRTRGGRLRSRAAHVSRLWLLGQAAGHDVGTRPGRARVGQLMHRLGYSRYVSQGGDWGAIISQVMAVQAPPGLLGIHINMPGTVPAERPAARSATAIRCPRASPRRRRPPTPRSTHFYNKGFGYAEMMNTRPQTLGYALADSPVGMARLLLRQVRGVDVQRRRARERALTRDEMLDDITLYWLTNTGTSSSRSYWDAAQGGGGPFNAFDIKTVPVAVTIFPGEIYRAPRELGRARRSAS